MDLGQIFSHLTPYDLLRMSRLNKDLRRVLISRSSITVWKSARSNDNECPDPPAGMSEPAWANLLFDAHCHVRVFRQQYYFFRSILKTVLSG